MVNALDKVLILDFGSQYTKLIARKIRLLKIYTIIQGPDVTLKKIKLIAPKCIILSGGPSATYQSNAPKFPQAIFQLNIPILGICYGNQLIAEQYGGISQLTAIHEYGLATLNIQKEGQLLKNLKNTANKNVWMSHSDSVVKLPEGFTCLAKTNNGLIAAMENAALNRYGIQFHPEVVHTPIGIDILKNFLVHIAKIKQDWNPAKIKETAFKVIDQQYQEKGKIIIAVSGGVDSLVLAVCLKEKFKNHENLLFVMVDTGLMRKNEVQEVKNIFDSLQCPLEIIDGKTAFLSNLKGVRDPERKRKIIGRTFIEIFESKIKSDKQIKYLAQGTLYPDVIESIQTTGTSVTIKSHHNVGGLPEKMKLKKIEPFSNFFKDEVRQLGKEFGLPKKFILRHPFPGPGLAVRILGNISQKKIDILKQADACFIEVLRKEKLYDHIWQAFVTLLPIKTVGVMGDKRTYDYVCVLRAITSQDGMTAEVYNFDMNFLKKVANMIINKVKGINRVVFDITSKPPATIEWE